ncbi:hypothetical protein R3W88_001296 [Solanum pinnatisectum]|uniref:Uncharacterized protein n=1 Tax=Solanum pinnatisectum TaxID=50273 RepID=A0AAV9MKP6_9SOLN|nr:hypothetical protein R3W88_001296 [Solanum pinnatisectum]
MLIIHLKVDLHVLKLELSSNKIVLTIPKRVLKSTIITEDIGFKPTSELKWKGNQEITTRRLQHIRDQPKPSNLNTSSSSQPRNSWKL